MYQRTFVHVDACPFYSISRWVLTCIFSEWCLGMHTVAILTGVTAVNRDGVVLSTTLMAADGLSLVSIPFSLRSVYFRSTAKLTSFSGCKVEAHYAIQGFASVIHTFSCRSYSRHDGALVVETARYGPGEFSHPVNLRLHTVFFAVTSCLFAEEL